MEAVSAFELYNKRIRVATKIVVRFWCLLIAWVWIIIHLYSIAKSHWHIISYVESSTSFIRRINGESRMMHGMFQSWWGGITVNYKQSKLIKKKWFIFSIMKLSFNLEYKFTITSFNMAQDNKIMKNTIVIRE